MRQKDQILEKSPSISNKSFHNQVALATIHIIQQSYPQARLFRSEAVLAKQWHSGAPMKLGTAGHSDIYGYIPICGIGVFVGIEIKTGKATLSPEQRVKAKNLEDAGGLFVIGRENLTRTMETLHDKVDKLIYKIVNQPPLAYNE